MENPGPNVRKIYGQMYKKPTLIPGPISDGSRTISAVLAAPHWGRSIVKIARMGDFQAGSGDFQVEWWAGTVEKTPN